MSEKERTFIEEFKKQVIGVAILYAFILILSLLGFYYNTNNALIVAERERIDLKKNQKELENSINNKINRDDYIREVTEMKSLLRDLNQKIDRIK